MDMTTYDIDNILTSIKNIEQGYYTVTKQIPINNSINGHHLLFGCLFCLIMILFFVFQYILFDCVMGLIEWGSTSLDFFSHLVKLVFLGVIAIFLINVTLSEQKKYFELKKQRDEHITSITTYKKVPYKETDITSMTENVLYSVNKNRKNLGESVPIKDVNTAKKYIEQKRNRGDDRYDGVSDK